MAQREGRRTELLVSTTGHRVGCQHLRESSWKMGLFPGLLPFMAVATPWHWPHNPMARLFTAEASCAELALVPQFVFNRSTYTGWL